VILVLVTPVVVACGSGQGIGLGRTSEGGAGPGDGAGGDSQVLTVNCDPAAQTGCALGQKCNLFCGASGPEFGCRPDQGTIGSGEACVPAASTGQDMCVRGTTCASTVHGTVCTRFYEGDAGCGSASCVTVRAIYPCLSNPTMNKPFSINVCE
jgi:hypothetical protein